MGPKSNEETNRGDREGEERRPCSRGRQNWGHAATRPGDQQKPEEAGKQLFLEPPEERYPCQS